MMKSAISYLSALLIGLGAASAHAAEEAQDPTDRKSVV